MIQKLQSVLVESCRMDDQNNNHHIHTILGTQIVLIKRTVFRRLTDDIRTSKDGAIKDGNSIHTHFNTHGTHSKH